MATEIISNGGGQMLPLDDLFARLESETLDRCFEDFGDFIFPSEDGTGRTEFFGNFYTFSHVFCIRTDDAATIARLTAAIQKNKQRQEYLDQPDKAARDRAREESWARLMKAQSKTAA
jgi:hypothetical protein